VGAGNIAESPGDDTGSNADSSALPSKRNYQVPWSPVAEAISGHRPAPPGLKARRFHLEGVSTGWRTGRRHCYSTSHASDGLAPTHGES
jgi:hypothetical protein